MSIKAITRSTGTYTKINDTQYFTPAPLPPRNPELQLSADILSLYGEASFALGQLNEMSLRLPNPNRFIRAYVIKEALLSSAIEGIHTTLIDVLTTPIGADKLNKNTQLVINYTKALETALDLIENKHMPLVSRVILQTHKVLMSRGAGDGANPGHYRQQSVRVGNLVPPPATQIPNLMSDLEKYINEESNLPLLIQAGLAHVQFETIHPFLDGNGRIGRLLIVLMLISKGLIDLPVLYPSYYFKKHRFEYYQRLDDVRKYGDYEGWIKYYLTAVRESALDAHRRAREIETLENNLKERIQHDENLNAMRGTVIQALEALFDKPAMSITELSIILGNAYNTSAGIMKYLCDINIVSETMINLKTKRYRFDKYIGILEKEY